MNGPPNDSDEIWRDQREKIIGLGEQSVRKTYYPELQQKLDQLERFRALLDQSHDLIFLLDAAALSVIDANDSACRQLGCTRDELFTLPLPNGSARRRCSGSPNWFPPGRKR